MQKNRLRRGFLLIELLIVIAIILIIAAIAVPKMNKQIMSAHEMAAISMIRSVHQGETQYYSNLAATLRIWPSSVRLRAVPPVLRQPISFPKISPTAKPADSFLP